MNLLLLLALGAIWGSSYLFIRVAVAEVPVLTLVGGRLLVSAAVLWGLLPILGHSIPRKRSLWGAYAFMGFFSGTLPYALISWGEQTISSGLAALLQATMPIFTVIMAHFFASDERMTLKGVLGVIVGFAGVSILILPELRGGVQANVLGQLAVVVSSVSYAGAAIFARGHLRGQPPLVSTMGQMTMGAVFTLPVALVVDRPSGLSPSLPAMSSWLSLTLLGTVVAYVIYYSLIERTSATFVSTVTYIIPVFGLILGALVLGEALNGLLLGSLALILLGVLLVRR
jgi:drug/metabolite transporter (DMT)-like permease